MQLADRIKDFIEANKSSGMSQNKFATALGINPAYISGYIKKGSSYKYADKVEEPAKNYLDNFIQKVDVLQDELPFVKTKDAKSIHAVIGWAVQDRDMAMISGVAGSGKTRAVREYVKTHPDSILIEATINTSAKSLFKILARELGLNDKGSIDELIRQSAQSLKKLIINLTASKSGNELEQLSSRVGNKWILGGLSYVDEDKKKIRDDLEAVCKNFGVTQKPCIDLIEVLAKGNFRKTEKLLRRAKMLSEYAKTPINEDVVKEATKMLLL